MRTLQAGGERPCQVGADHEEPLHRDVRVAGAGEQRHHGDHVPGCPQGGVRQQGLVLHPRGCRRQREEEARGSGKVLL